MFIEKKITVLIFNERSDVYVISLKFVDGKSSYFLLYFKVYFLRLSNCANYRNLCCEFI